MAANTPQAMISMSQAGVSFVGSIARPVIRFSKRKPLGAVGGAILIAMVVTAVFAPQIAPYDFVRGDRSSLLSPPSATHLFGTDLMGRDVLSRIVYGTRVSIFVGVAAIIIGSSVGAVLGVTSAYIGGRFDMILQRLMDIFLAFPGLVLALAIVASLGVGLDKTVIAIAVNFVPRTNRVVRSVSLSIAQSTYVEAARCIGCSSTRIVFRHILPNTVGPFLVIATASLGGAILFEASLSFLGLGVPAPQPSFGSSLSDATYFIRTAPWLTVFPAIALSLAIFGINFLGDALRDTLDPRLRRRV